MTHRKPSSNAGERTSTMYYTRLFHVPQFSKNAARCSERLASTVFALPYWPMSTFYTGELGGEHEALLWQAALLLEVRDASVWALCPRRSQRLKQGVLTQNRNICSVYRNPESSHDIGTWTLRVWKQVASPSVVFL